MVRPVGHSFYITTIAVKSERSGKQTNTTKHKNEKLTTAEKITFNDRFAELMFSWSCSCPGQQTHVQAYNLVLKRITININKLKLK